jgi:hypothetical protein
MSLANTPNPGLILSIDIIFRRSLSEAMQQTFHEHCPPLINRHSDKRELHAKAQPVYSRDTHIHEEPEYESKGGCIE